MTMLILGKGQRELLAEKLADVANLVFAGLVLSQFLSATPFSFSLAAFGLAFWILLTLSALWIRGGMDK